MAKLDVNTKWQAEMLPYFAEIEPGKRPDESFVRLEEVFHLD
jgi:L-rhamnose mutarotase